MRRIDTVKELSYSQGEKNRHCGLQLLLVHRSVKELSYSQGEKNRHCGLQLLLVHRRSSVVCG
jgi:anti-sigma regulatory factor (Ser/Thr protein kinase)